MDQRRTLPCLQWKRYWRAVTFRIGDSGQRLILRPAVLNHLARYQQTTPTDFEAGGQLFARFIDADVHVERATGPRPTDRRSRYPYPPHPRAEQEEIDAAHREGLHFIGDWHTHPQPIPAPSPRDSRSIRSAVAHSKHHLNGFVLMIVGTDLLPRGLFIALYGPESVVEITPDTGAQRT